MSGMAFNSQWNTCRPLSFGFAVSFKLIRLKAASLGCKPLNPLHLMVLALHITVEASSAGLASKLLSLIFDDDFCGLGQSSSVASDYFSGEESS
mmetsp:Transcript_3756/g.5683  ORF Transcript_3756/g.5683 Transcript_3756/m.5683 type:complete len:94 (-) Transcript_3756:115-396(-)